MAGYLMMMYITVEQEESVKQLFKSKGWRYIKPDFSAVTDSIGPIPVSYSDSLKKNIPAAVKKSSDELDNDHSNASEAESDSINRVQDLDKSRQHYKGITHTDRLGMLGSVVGKVRDADTRSDVKKKIISVRKIEQHCPPNVSISELLLKSRLPVGDKPVVLQISKSLLGKPAKAGESTGNIEGSGTSEKKELATPEKAGNVKGSTKLLAASKMKKSRKILTKKKTVKTNSNRKKTTSTDSDAVKKNGIDSDVRQALVRNSNKCFVCGKDYPTLQSLIGHQKMHKKVKASLLRPFVCTYETCSKAFHTSKRLEDHLRVHSREIPCNICGKKFTSLKGFNYHMMSLHSDGGRCTNCGKMEANKDALDTHFKACFNEAGYPCKLCGAVFRYLNSLKSHYAVHSKKKQDKETGYQCRTCRKKFPHKRILERHVRSKTCNDTNTYSATRGEHTYTCYNCNHTFATMQHFHSHCKDNLCSGEILEEKNDSCATNTLQAGKELDSKKRKDISLPQSGTKKKKIIGSNVSNVPASGDSLLVENTAPSASKSFEGDFRASKSKPEANVNITKLEKRGGHNESVERESIHNDKAETVIDENQWDVAVEGKASLIEKNIDLPVGLETDCPDVSITERSVKVIPERMVDIDSLQDLANAGDGIHYEVQEEKEVIHVYELTG